MLRDPENGCSKLTFKQLFGHARSLRILFEIEVATLKHLLQTELRIA